MNEKINSKWKCPKCGNQTYFYDEAEQAIDNVWPQKICLSCGIKPTVDSSDAVIDVSGNEQTTLIKIAEQSLVGREIILSDRKGHVITSVSQPGDGSRMSATVITKGGSVKRLYLPTKFELIPRARIELSEDEGDLEKLSSLALQMEDIASTMEDRSSYDDIVTSISILVYDIQEALDDKNDDTIDVSKGEWI